MSECTFSSYLYLGENIWVNAGDLLSFVDEYLCGTPRKPQKKALVPVLLPVTVSLSLIHTVTAAVVMFPLKLGSCCLVFGKGYLDWLVEVHVVLGDSSGKGHDFHHFLPPSW